MRITAALILVLGGPFLHAQTLFNDGNTISIMKGAIFTILGDATNDGKIINDGSFIISGGWINNNEYDAGDGTFILNSANNQVVNHNAQSFSRLRIVGGGHKIFQGDLTIEEELSLVDGLLISENSSRLIVGQGAKVTGGSEAAYVAGPIVRNGSGSLFFPTGSTSEYLPAYLENVEGDNPQITLQAFSVAPPFVAGSSLDKISALRYWQMDASGYNGAFITLPVINESIADAIDNLVVAGADTGAFENLGAQQTEGTLSGGFITSEAKALSAFYTLGSVERDEYISVINAVTPGLLDGKHDFLEIKNIKSYANNKVEVFNRWGDRVFEIDGYDNDERVFIGEGNTSFKKSLDSGTYYYVIKAGGEVFTGFFLLIQ